jgi:uncharacterized LabA/DUF88 family protein
MADNKAPRRKAIVYIDGYNLYFAIKEKGWQGLLWLDIVTLARNLLGENQDLVRVKYFTARIKRPEDKRLRQNLYLDALSTLSDLDIYYGDYQQNTMTCLNCANNWLDDREKQTDVNIAIQMLNDAHTSDKVDDLLLITADSDQCPAMNMIRSMGKRVVIVLPPGRNTYLEIQKSADGRLTLKGKKLRDALLPSTLTRIDGFIINRPPEYKPID